MRPTNQIFLSTSSLSLLPHTRRSSLPPTLSSSSPHAGALPPSPSLAVGAGASCPPPPSRLGSAPPLRGSELRRPRSDGELPSPPPAARWRSSAPGCRATEARARAPLPFLSCTQRPVSCGRGVGSSSAACSSSLLPW
ncbi:hypothetical protein PVAP13_5KG190407 [Panicum virgatum]|uniref:Uncharacterized protein n=1 Tax=Panicum virgatum TaxID=38727 RepID=A0A8T0SIF6_PANVG|nr:hypothetical protein PVAP13_5KG190407 [Panicum virgatum]